MACPGEGCPPRSRIVRVQNEPHRPQNLLKRGRRVDAHLRLWGRNQGTWYLRRKLRGVSHHIRKIACVRGRSPGLYAAKSQDLCCSALSLDNGYARPNRPEAKPRLLWSAGTANVCGDPGGRILQDFGDYEQGGEGRGGCDGIEESRLSGLFVRASRPI